MNPITSPLSPKNRGSEVKNLHNVLQLLIKREMIRLSSRQQPVFNENFPAEKRKGIYGVVTECIIRTFQKQNQLRVIGEVDSRTADALNSVLLQTGEIEEQTLVEQFAIRGKVCYADGRTFTGSLVRAFDKDLRSEELLGECYTDRQGEYEITYTSRQFIRAEKKSADLRVRAFLSEKNENKEIAQSPLIFNAKPEEIIDLVVNNEEFRGPSEYEKLLSEITPLLQGVLIHELNEEDITFITGETEIAEQKIRFLVKAHIFLRETDITPEFYYGLFREGVPADLDCIFKQPLIELRRFITQALKDNLVPSKLNESIDTILSQINENAVKNDLEKDNGLGALLSTSTLLARDRKRQEKVVRAIRDNNIPLTELWDRLGKDHEFSDDNLINELKSTIELGGFSQNHLPLVKLLQEKLHGRNGAVDLRNLAVYSAKDWKILIKQSGFPVNTPGNDDEEKEKNYLESLSRAVEARFPTAVAVNRLKQERVAIPDAQVLIDAFESNQEFDLATIDFDGKLKECFDDQSRNALKSWRRIFNLSPVIGRYVAMKTLKTAGLDSAQRIVQLGPSVFRNRFSETLGEECTLEIWDNATTFNGMVLTLLTKYSPQFNQLMPKSINFKSIPSLPDEFEGKATLEELFGSMDFCECEHCKSVYSPAAYFVDLMQFLKNATIKTNGRSPLSFLLSRRPDLAEIELSCENTNIKLPYVDLVNEVLENAITRFLLSISVKNLEDLSSITDKLNPNYIKYYSAIQRQFNSAGYHLTENARVISLEKDCRWLVIDGTDQNFAIIFESKIAQLYVYVLQNRQTRSKEEELSAQPEYLNKAAYIRLSQAFHPWNLPFDLWWEEANIYMKHLGLQRSIWIERLLSWINADSRMFLAAYDYLRITTFDYYLITGSQVLPEPELWGIEKGGSIDTLRNAKILLKQACLESKVLGENFKTLRQIVYTHFVDPEKEIEIKFRCECCDLGQAELIHKAAAQADWTKIFSRIRRFLRLQRKIGFSISELDKALTTFGVSDIKTPLFFLQLSNLERLHKNLGTPRLELLSWWGMIDTAEDRSEEDRIRRTPSLYEKTFLNRAVDNPSNILFELDANGIELKCADKHFKISDTDDMLTSFSLDISASVAGALEISVPDLKRLLKNPYSQDDWLAADELNLENLGNLYRLVSCAKALRLKIKDFVSARSIIGINPFNDSPGMGAEALRDRTFNSREFVDRVSEIQKSAFSIAELDYLLRNLYEEAVDLFVPTDGEIAAILSEISEGLAKIASEGVNAPDPDGSLTAKRLNLLTEPTIAEQIVKLLIGEKTTISWPSTVIDPILPNELAIKITFDKHEPKAPIIIIQGPLTVNENNQLQLLTMDIDFKAEIQKLFDSPRTFIKQNLKDNLDNLSLSWLVETMIQALDQKSAQEERVGDVLEAVNEYLCRTLSENLIKERIAGSLSLSADITAMLLEKLINSQIDNNKPALTDFLELAAPIFSVKQGTGNIRMLCGMIRAEKSGRHVFRLEQNGNILPLVQGTMTLLINDRAIVQNDIIDLEAGKFYPVEIRFALGQKPVLFWETPSLSDQPVASNRIIPAIAIDSYRLLHKCSLLINKFRINADELSYLTANSCNFKNFDLNKFPLKPVLIDAVQYEQWRHLNMIFTFRDNYSQVNKRLIDVFSAAKNSFNDAKEQLLALTGWGAIDFEVLAGKDGFYLTQENMKCGEKLDKLHDAFVHLKRLGISARQLHDWVESDLGAVSVSIEDPVHQKKEIVVQSLKQVVKSKYDSTQWTKIAKSLRDEIREKQRQALVAYLIHDLRLKDTNELYERFLIDVEMSPCMLTSRIVQATGTIQLFVQRILMGLETGVQAWLGMAEEWKWRKNYRVWEANRKIFLYPENWIEPELRDDKTPFFEDLENELLQNEITDEKVEKALLGYLYKLDEVARLEIVGMYEQTDGWYESKEKTTCSYVLHVFGRTYKEPHVYYYRRWIDRKYWTPWEKVDLDIEGDHLIPVVWNRRLYLFWPIFSEKTVELAATKQSSNTTYKYNKDHEITESQTTNNQESKPPEKYWDIQIARSEYKHGKWAAKKMCTKKTPFQILETGYYETNYYHFKTKINEDILINLFCTEMGTTKKIGNILLNDNLTSSFNDDNINEDLPILKNTQPEYMMFVKNDLEMFGQLYLWPYVHSVLSSVPTPYKVLFPHQHDDIPPGPIFYQDKERTFIIHVCAWIPSNYAGMSTMISPLYSFSTFYHPFISYFIKHLNKYGIEGLLNPLPDTEPFTDRRQLAHVPYGDKEFFSEYNPQCPLIVPIEDIDFSLQGSYSIYNWEIFFHIPLLIADSLSKNRRFEEAMKWFHCIFNPLETADGDAPQRYWKLRPFYEEYAVNKGVPKNIQELMILLNKGDQSTKEQVELWKKNPFKPHLIARIRTSAYMKTVVMKYLDNLIAWADQLFRQFTMESINEATQLYILAAEILGPRPEQVPAAKRPNYTYRQLEQKKLDDLSNVLIGLENKLMASNMVIQSFLQLSDAIGSFSQVPTVVTTQSDSDGKTSSTIIGSSPKTAIASTTKKCTTGEMLTIGSLFFCNPYNDKLLGYWNTVEDRLFKIRHCMTIEGQVLQLPLFQPPIDPALLVRAAAAGVDIASVLNDMSAPLPHYRFQVMLQKALEFCNEVRSLGQTLLSTLEKKDAEEMALLRSKHESELFKSIKDIKKKQIEETTAAKNALVKTKELLQYRQNHYTDLIKNGLNANEKFHLDSIEKAAIIQAIGQMLEMTASNVSSAPDAITGGAGLASPVVLAKIGSSNVASGLSFYAKYMSMMASIMSSAGNAASIRGGFQRREEEWKLQQEIAKIETDQIDKQLAAADIRVAIAEKELENQEKQIENAGEVEAYLKSKFTSKELYNWMISQVSSLYFGSYQLAYDLAKRAEMAFRYELGLQDSNFIKFGYWDSLKKGLLAGEKLHLDLKRMENSFIEGNRREFEITKNVSLAVVNPIELLNLRQTGECYLNIPEELFDLDYPGHYMRRLKSVSITIPCVAGPFTGVNCTLTLLKSSVRNSCELTNGTVDGYLRDSNNEDTRFTDNLGAIQSIVTSSGQNDNGLFEANIRDERYLPFEGCGATNSSWRIELNNEFRQFDYETISDIILHLRYTARDGGEILKKAATENLSNYIKDNNATATTRLFWIRQEFPGEWVKFKNAKVNLGDMKKSLAELTIDLKPEHYPFWSMEKLNEVVEARVITDSDKIVVVYGKNDGTGKKDELNSSYAKFKGGVLKFNKPIKPTGAFTLYFDDNSMSNVWITITWKNSAASP